MPEYTIVLSVSVCVYVYILYGYMICILRFYLLYVTLYYTILYGLRLPAHRNTGGTAACRLTEDLLKGAPDFATRATNQAAYTYNQN